MTALALAALATAASAAGLTAYVTHEGDTAITPLALGTGLPWGSVTLDNLPSAIAIAPDGNTIYVGAGRRITPIDAATETPGAPIYLGGRVDSIAFTPDGSKAYVSVELAARTLSIGEVIPITVATGALGTPIPVGEYAGPIAITPDGRTALVATTGDTVTPIQLASGTAGGSIGVGSPPSAIAITPDGSTALVATAAGLTPIAVAADTPGRTIPLVPAPNGIAIAPDGKSAYLSTNAGMTVVSLTPHEPVISLGLGVASALAITPDGSTAYVVLSNKDVVEPVALATDTPGAPISAGFHPAAIVLTGTVRRQTTLSIGCPPPSFFVGYATPCMATVTDTDTGAPTTPTGTVQIPTNWVGQGSSCTLTGTGASASCTLTYMPALVPKGVREGEPMASYSGDPQHTGSTSTLGLGFGRLPTDTTISCQPAQISLGQSASCTVVVTDIAGGLPYTPMGFVQVHTRQTGTVNGGGCVLSGAGPTATCQTMYTPSVAGSNTLAAYFVGSNTNRLSFGTTVVKVLP